MSDHPSTPPRRRPAEQRPLERVSTGTVRRVERASGELSTAAVSRMEETLPWFAAMPAQQRSWVGLVAQTGIAAFVTWLRRPEADPQIPLDVFAAAPRELTRAIPLKQVVQLIRAAVGVVEAEIPGLASEHEQPLLREAALRYSREIAFAAAHVYASAAEQRGAWDARLQALLVDALLRGDADVELLSRSAALGWRTPPRVCGVVGCPPVGEPESVLDALQRLAHGGGHDLLAGVHGDRLVAVVGTAADPWEVVGVLLPEFGEGPVVVGPTVPDLASAPRSLAAALAALRAAAAWPDAPRPVLADDLLAERAIDGDAEARRQLLEGVYIPLREAGGSLLTTAATYLASGSSLEGTARQLFLHPNTVRYRLRRAATVTGLAAGDAHDALALRVAITLGRITDGSRHEPASPPPPENGL